jgi:hypothetical protein
VVTAKGTPGDHHGVAREHEAGLSHARWMRTKRARVPESDFNALRGLSWRIPSSAAADANEGGVVGNLLRPDYQVPLRGHRFGVIDITTPGRASKIANYADSDGRTRYLLNVLYK